MLECAWGIQHCPLQGTVISADSPCLPVYSRVSLVREVTMCWLATTGQLHNHNIKIQHNKQAF